MNSTNASIQRGPLLRKSRAGCRDCRIRKVKCDEVRPVCSNCRRRYVNTHLCDWNTNTSSNSSNSSEEAPLLPRDLSVQVISKYATVSQIPSMDLHPSSVSSTSRWRRMELRLMYHYTSIVSLTMPDCNGAPIEAWQNTIPQLAFDSEVLLNPMLALSALHLHSHSANNPEMAIALRRYLDRSLVQHRQALSTPDKTPSEQLWLSSVLLSHMYWLLAHQPQPNQTYEFPLQALKILGGARLVFKQNSVPLSQQGYVWLGDETMPLVLPESSLSESSQMQLRSLEANLAEVLDAFEVQSMAADRKNIYIEAKDFVLYHYRAFFSGVNTKTLQRFVGFMAMRCQPGFLKMLEQHDPLALALMARMLVLLSALEYAWWIHGKGEYEVIERDIRGIRGIMPEILRWVMDWPCEVLDGDVVLSRD